MDRLPPWPWPAPHGKLPFPFPCTGGRRPQAYRHFPSSFGLTSVWSLAGGRQHHSLDQCRHTPLPWRSLRRHRAMGRGGKSPAHLLPLGEKPGPHTLPALTLGRNHTSRLPHLLRFAARQFCSLFLTDPGPLRHPCGLPAFTSSEEALVDTAWVPGPGLGVGPTHLGSGPPNHRFCTSLW